MTFVQRLRWYGNLENVLREYEGMDGTSLVLFFNRTRRGKVEHTFRSCQSAREARQTVKAMESEGWLNCWRMLGEVYIDPRTERYVSGVRRKSA